MLYKTYLNIYKTHLTYAVVKESNIVCKTSMSPFSTHNLTPVSYTHLDVYKRQVIRLNQSINNCNGVTQTPTQIKTSKHQFQSKKKEKIQFNFSDTEETFSWLTSKQLLKAKQLLLMPTVRHWNIFEGYSKIKGTECWHVTLCYSLKILPSILHATRMCCLMFCIIHDKSGPHLNEFYLFFYLFHCLKTHQHQQQWWDEI